MKLKDTQERLETVRREYEAYGRNFEEMSVKHAQELDVLRTIAEKVVDASQFHQSRAEFFFSQAQFEKKRLLTLQDQETTNAYGEVCLSSFRINYPCDRLRLSRILIIHRMSFEKPRLLKLEVA